MSLNAYDANTERALLACAITNLEASAGAFLSVPPQAFYVGRHQRIAHVLREMTAKRLTVDPVTLGGYLMDQGLATNENADPAGKVSVPYIHTMLAQHYVVQHAMDYASRVLDLYARRRLSVEMGKIGQRLDADWEQGEESESIAAAIGQLRSTMDELIKYAAGAASVKPTSLADFLAQDSSYDWLIPGLIERRDRLILTGEEGFGKSELTFQLALCLAGGVHPFMAEEVPGEHRVLMIDCENSPNQSRRRARRIRAAVDQTRVEIGLEPVSWEKRLHIEHRGAGLDLTDGSDVAWLENLISDTAPDLVTLGPLYKLHAGDINSGELAKKLLFTIDQLRERHGFAFISEAHASKASDTQGKRLMAPEGSGLFLRWPEFGFGLRRNKVEGHEGEASVIGFRGAREERDWPRTLVRGYDGMLPWRPDVEYYDHPSVPRV